MLWLEVVRRLPRRPSRPPRSRARRRAARALEQARQQVARGLAALHADAVPRGLKSLRDAGPEIVRDDAKRLVMVDDVLAREPELLRASAGAGSLLPLRLVPRVIASKDRVAQEAAALRVRARERGRGPSVRPRDSRAVGIRASRERVSDASEQPSAVSPMEAGTPCQRSRAHRAPRRRPRARGHVQGGRAVRAFERVKTGFTHQYVPSADGTVELVPMVARLAEARAELRTRESANA